MSSTFPVIAPAKPKPGSRTWNAFEVARCAFLGVTSLGVALRTAHVSGGASHTLRVAVGILMVVCFAEQYNPQNDSPLDIDATIRLIRSVVVATVLVVGEIIVFPQSRPVAARALTSFDVLSICASFTARGSPLIVSPGISVLEAGSADGYLRLKRVLDICGATLACLVLSPLLALIAVAVKLDSCGPVLFRHERVGKDGKSFHIFKFRSMLTSASAYERSPSHCHDPRITRVGRIIRRLGLDELPQLINVMRGDMSVVGPRPEMPFIVRSYTTEQRKRLDAVPGITGLWQISPGRALPIHENLHYDLYYIAHQSLLLDIAIVVRTFTSVIRGIGAV